MINRQFSSYGPLLLRPGIGMAGIAQLHDGQRGQAGYGPVRP